MRIPGDRGKGELPIMCTLSSRELADRRDELLPGLVQKAAAIDRLEHGVRLTFAPDDGLLTELARVIDRERQCCQFLRFDLSVAPARGPIRLEVTGPPGTADFLADLLP